MPKMYDFHWSNAKYMNPSRATIPLIRQHQCDSDGGRIRGVLLYNWFSKTPSLRPIVIFLRFLATLYRHCMCYGVVCDNL